MIDVPAFINWFFGLLTAKQWDAWRNSLATIGGLIALFVAVRTYRANSRSRRFEQARLVYAKVRKLHTHVVGSSFDVKLVGEDFLSTNEDGLIAYAENPDKGMKLTALVPLVRVSVIVHNGSKERIGPAYVSVYNRSARSTFTAGPSFEHIDPETEVTAEFVVRLPDAGEPVVGASLKFLDASGKWWKRHLLEPVRRARKVKQESVIGTYWVYTNPPPTGGPSAGWREKVVQMPPGRWQRLKAWWSQHRNKARPARKP